MVKSDGACNPVELRHGRRSSSRSSIFGKREGGRSPGADGGTVGRWLLLFLKGSCCWALRQRHGAGLHPCCLRVLRENFPFPPLDRKCNVYSPAEVGTVGLWFKKTQQSALVCTFVVDEIRWQVVQVEQKTFGVHIQVLDVSVRTVSTTFRSWQRIHTSAQTHAQRPTVAPPPPLQTTATTTTQTHTS